MFNKGIYLSNVLLVQGNIIVGTPDKSEVLYALKPHTYTNLQHSVTDTIGQLCTGNDIHHYTTPEERQQFLEWFNTNVNNIEELHIKAINRSIRVSSNDKETRGCIPF